MRILIGGVAALFVVCAAPQLAVATPAPTATPTAGVPIATRSTHHVPPPAPKPTAHGNSPAAPDPHPPRGGIGPLGEPVGGKRLLTRHNVLPAHAQPLPTDLTARAWVLADLDTGDVIAARDPHGRYQPASIQKILTTDTLLRVLPGNRVVTVSSRAANTEGSHAGLVGGGRYTIDQIFRGLLLVSGNDCAEALAQAAGGRQHTVAMMNAEAQRLGGYDTYVQTPSGLDGWQQLTSAYDMTLFLRAAIRQPRFVAYERALTTTLPSQRAHGVGPIKLFNQNVQFLTTVKGALVAKTGYTDAAQHTFAGVIKRNGHHYGVVFMRAQRWPDDQWVQATKLVNWGLHLPKGTAPVGHLAAALTLSHLAKASATPASASASPAKPHHGSGSTTAARIFIFIGLLAVGAGVLMFRGRRRR